MHEVNPPGLVVLEVKECVLELSNIAPHLNVKGVFRSVLIIQPIIETQIRHRNNRVQAEDKRYDKIK